MAIHVALHHKTGYVYDRPVSLTPQVVRLRPAVHARTPILSYSLKVTPANHFINWQQDPQGNFLARLVFPEKVTEFHLEVDLIAELAVYNPFDFFLEPEAEKFPFAYDPILSTELAPYLVTEPAGPLLTQYVDSISRQPMGTVDFLVALNQRLQNDIGYVIRMEPGIQTCEDSLSKRTGSCRDSAWLLVQILRHLGLAARFVSGYLIQLTADQKALDGPSGTDVDFTDLHAWTEVYLPGAGWIGFDPTSGLLAGEGHIPLACAPDPVSAAPVSGGVEQCEVSFDFDMSIARVYESPRVTKPYTEDQWEAIDRLGHAVDDHLKAGDVRLTMGGEPTFVSIDDMDGAEWNTAAVGPTKRALAFDLIHRLRQRFAPAGMLTFGQGKWYPGESLPRWSFALYWRGDGKPLWVDGALVADERRDYKVTGADSRRFTEALAERLGLDPDYVLDAYEDPFHYIAREGRLPVNVDPTDSKLKDPEERARLAKVFSAGLDAVVGQALPIQCWHGHDEGAHAGTNPGRRWVTGPWPFRRGRMYLMPGDSPLGFRLPLDELPWIPPASYPWYTPADPFTPRGPLHDPVRLHQRARQGEPEAQDPSHAGKQMDQRPTPSRRPRAGAVGLVSDTIRTALGVQPRDGKLCVFMPPLETADDYVDLVAAIEDAAATTGLPVHLEGYPPPPDSRLNVIRVTPDPGVIEVNIHPTSTWGDLEAVTTTLYEEARQSRLGTEKFMIDGRHVGTGGGNHIVVGGATAADSPFLRRPDLLASLVRYWQNHPSLSYLFSGLFIGPTSQAPRVDEARDDALYELEVALRQIPLPGTPYPGGDIPPWLVDRILRNVLVDVTGNTHRTEICIDKLYSPDGPTGRLGLVEFRAFEMPPHSRMSLVQHLLLRALIARFWETPYTMPLVRWGHALRDKFMLPHYVWEDFRDVLADMRGAGYAFDDAWFHPHFEFRFPRYGEVHHGGVSLEVRHALEPWHVMGEEPGPGGTVRYVDSSLERLQIKVRGLTDRRHAVTCNGYKLPLQPTGTPGEYVAGVRYRAWQPASALHPTIGVHSPLSFEVADTWNRRSLGGCVYHVTHPGGRNYVTFPINANEAESRRLARFQLFGHTPGGMRVIDPGVNPDFPTTLDLRLYS